MCLRAFVCNIIYIYNFKRLNLTAYDMYIDIFQVKKFVTWRLPWAQSQSRKGSRFSSKAEVGILISKHFLPQRDDIYGHFKKCRKIPGLVSTVPKNELERSTMFFYQLFRLGHFQ